MAVGTRVSSKSERPLTQMWNGHSWQDKAAPAADARLRSFLAGVSCVSKSRCLAVGSSFGTRTHGGFAERWNGTRWALLHLDFPAGAQLLAVSCAGSTCMITGLTVSTSSVQQPLAMELNGSRLTRERIRRPAGAAGGDLNGVSCTSKTACMTVGTWLSKSGHASAMAYRWQGSGWKATTVPHPAGRDTVLGSVSCAAGGQCLAVGGPEAGIYPGANLTLRWRDNHWMALRITGQPVPGFVPVQVSCATRSACAVVGTGLTASQPGALIWNGRSLRVSAVAEPQTGDLGGVSCPEPARCVAVGGYADNGPDTFDGALAELWTGATWTLLPVTS
jgi:hypothetical protein